MTRLIAVTTELDGVALGVDVLVDDGVPVVLVLELVEVVVIAVDVPDAVAELLVGVAVAPLPALAVFAVAVAPVVELAGLVAVDTEQAASTMASARPMPSQINNFFARFGPEAERCGVGLFVVPMVIPRA